MFMPPIGFLPMRLPFLPLYLPASFQFWAWNSLSWKPYTPLLESSSFSLESHSWLTFSQYWSARVWSLECSVLLMLMV